MTVLIRAQELSRWYGIVMGLNNVTFQIEPGLTGLVGPNGAGKSTLIQIITGQLKPSSGQLTVFGLAPWNNPPLLRRIGYCPEGEAVPKELRPMEWLEGLGLLSGLRPDEVQGRAEAILDKVKLPREHWGKRLGQYSKGMKQRVKLGQALLHEPDLLVLDEPMNGLDPMGRQEMAHTLKDLSAAGVSILVSSHILAELEALCQHSGSQLGPHSRLGQSKRNPQRHQELARRTGDRVRCAGEAGPPPLRRRRAGGLRFVPGRRTAAHPRQGRRLVLRAMDRLAAGERRHGPRHPQSEPVASKYL